MGWRHVLPDRFMTTDMIWQTFLSRQSKEWIKRRSTIMYESEEGVWYMNSVMRRVGGRNGWINGKDEKHKQSKKLIFWNVWWASLEE